MGSPRESEEKSSLVSKSIGSPEDRTAPKEEGTGPACDGRIGTVYVKNDMLVIVMVVLVVKLVDCEVEVEAGWKNGFW